MSLKDFQSERVTLFGPMLYLREDREDLKFSVFGLFTVVVLPQPPQISKDVISKQRQQSSEFFINGLLSEFD